MKRYFITLLILPLLISCENDKIEMMLPYIFFTYDVDTYVMDMDNPNLGDYTIKGSISAEGQFSTFNMGGEELGKEELRDATNMMFEHTVSLSGKNASFDIPFVLTDLVGNTVTKPFHFLTSTPIESYKALLGAQNNPYEGLFFSFEDKKVHSLAEMMEMNDPKGICFGYNVNKKVPMLVSPTELINQTILSNYKGKSITSFCEIVAFNNIPFTKESFEKMKNNAFMRNLNPVEYGTYAFTTIETGKSYLFKNEDDTLRGILHIESLETGIGGQTLITIKM